jgi:hypothetical protein
VSVGRAVALGQGDVTDDERRDEQHRHADEETAQTPVRSLRSNGVPLGGALARLEELTLEIVEVGRVHAEPVPCRRQASAAVEVGGVAAALVPGMGRLNDMPLECAAIRILFEPRPQARPLAQQSLVGDLGGSLRDGHEPGVREDRHRSGGIAITIQIELHQRRLSTDDLSAFARRRESKEDPLGRCLLRLVEARVRVFGEPCDRSLHASRS